MTNYKKLSWRHRVTEPELPLFFSGKDSLKIDRSIKMPLHRPSMGAVGSGSWVSGKGKFGRLVQFFLFWQILNLWAVKYIFPKTKIWKIKFKTAEIAFFFVSRHNLRAKMIDVLCRSHVKGLSVNWQPLRAICYLSMCPNADWLSIIGFQVRGGVIQQTVNCTRNLNLDFPGVLYFDGKITTSRTSLPDGF